MKYLEDSRLTRLTSDLTGAFLNTRGSGATMGLANLRSTANNRSSKGTKGGKNNKQNQSNNSSSSPRKNNTKKSPTPPTASYCTYNPEGYGSSAGASSCRVIYGRIEAYNTKRAGSDKKTAHEVGERYAHEMERLNKAVEALKKRHHDQLHLREQELFGEKGTTEEGKEAERKNNEPKPGKMDNNGGKNTKKIERRRRSRSVDGVTFATSTSPQQMVFDKTENASSMMGTVEEGIAFKDNEANITTEENHHKRDLPLEGILKQPSMSNKRCRATSFDISTGPNTRQYHHDESSTSLLAGSSSWGNSTMGNNTLLPLSVVHPTGNSFEEDVNIHPLIPQPSLYQSELGEHDGGNPDHSIGKTVSVCVLFVVGGQVAAKLSGCLPLQDISQ